MAMGLHYCGSLLFAIRKYIMQEMILRNHGECIWILISFQVLWKLEKRSALISLLLLLQIEPAALGFDLVFCGAGLADGISFTAPSKPEAQGFGFGFSFWMGAFFSNLQEKILIQCSSGYEAGRAQLVWTCTLTGEKLQFWSLKKQPQKTWTLAFAPVQQTCSPASAVSGLKRRARK